MEQGGLPSDPFRRVPVGGEMRHVNWGPVIVDCVLIVSAGAFHHWWFILFTFLTGGYVKRECPKAEEPK